MIKNIILTSAVDNKNYMGKVSVENTSDKTLINLKTYNLPQTQAKRVLGIIIDNNLYKVDIKNDENFIIDKNLDLSNKISVVLLEVENNKTEILVWGSNETSRVWQNSVLHKIDEEDRKSSNESLNLNVQKNAAQEFIENLKKEVEEDDFESDEYIEALVDKSFNNEYNTDFKNNYKTYANNLEDCENSTTKDEKQFEFENNLNENNTNNKSEFLSSVESQIIELLNTYEEERALEELIPSSKFVKVDLENNGNFYIFGVIYENNEIKYIVYGLPGEYGVKPEDEYSKYYQWLPLNSENPEGYGYYLMYQEAGTGEQVEMIID